MNLIDAVKSGKIFRKLGTEDWLQVSPWGMICWCDAGKERVTPSDLCLVSAIIGEWEVQEPSVTITRAQFWEAAEQSFGFNLNKGVFGSIIKYNGKDPPKYYELSLLAKKLGLEP